MNDIASTQAVAEEVTTLPPPPPTPMIETLPNQDRRPDPTENLTKLNYEPEKTFPLSIGVKRPSPKGGGQLETITKVTLRAPLGLDLFEIDGTATRSYWTPNGLRMEMDAAKLRQYLIRLSGLDGGVIAQFPGRDIKLMYQWISRELSIIEGN